MKSKGRVMTFGSFDMIHEGHSYYLNQAKKYGDTLITIIASDKNIRKIKGKDPLYSEITRKKQVEELSICDRVYIGSEHDPLTYIKILRPETICLGYDQKSQFTKLLENHIALQKDYNPQIIRIEGFKINECKSSIMKQKKGLHS